MTRYEELAYLFSNEHFDACCDFANFLADELAIYLECDRNKIGFDDKNSSGNAPFLQCNAAIVEKCSGFVYLTIAIILPNEPSLGSQVRSIVRLQKIQDSFRVQIKHGIRESHILRREDREALHTFYESLFNSFINPEIWEAL
jgi:hypothetical protein